MLQLQSDPQPFSDGTNITDDIGLNENFQKSN